jgi:hypothetical protein
MTVEEYDDDYEEGSGPTRWVIAAIVAVALIAGAFFAGRAMAGGPSTLAEAVQQARSGDLPCGDTGTATPPPSGAPGNFGDGFALRALCGQQGTPQNGTGRRFGAAGGLGFGLSGQVVSVKGDTLTLRSPRGSQTIKLGPSTTISRASKGSSSDLKAGDTVIVGGAGRGTTSGAAQSVLIVPSRGGSNG